MCGFFIMCFATMWMKTRRRKTQMGALIWMLFIAVVTVVLERETFFS